MQLPSVPGGLADPLGSAERTVAANRRFGLLGAALAAGGFGLQAVIFAANSGTLDAIRHGDLIDLALLLPIAVAAGGVVLLTFRRSWIAQSTEPFRYTINVDRITRLEPEGAEGEPLAGIDGASRLEWLGTDLTEMLSDQVSRFSWVDESKLPESDTDRWTSHVHIRGHYACRETHRPAGYREIQVRLWIRIGPPGSSEIFTVPVNYTLDPRSGEAESVTESDYEKIIYRVFVSVMTSLYRCLKEDVAQKISRLPPGRLRAAAYFHEAADYEESGTIDAYAEAGKLYEQAAANSPTESRAPARLVRLVPRWERRVQERRVLAAESLVGVARTCLYRWLLAHVSNRPSKLPFDARPQLDDALAVLREVPNGSKGREDALHAATVTVALANTVTHGWGAARLALHEARSMRPTDPDKWAALELYTTGTLEHRAISRLQYIRAAAARAPKWQVARFRLIREMEMLWRRRETLERDVARDLVDEYRSLNPGIIAGWESAAYIHWLLAEEGDPYGDLGVSEVLLERGREYSKIQQDTFVSDIEYGLARIAAEKGEVALAYRYYVAAIAGGVAPGVDGQYTRSAPYYTQTISHAIMRRFVRYRDTALAALDGERTKHPDNGRMVDSVRAFVLNDFGKAAMQYFESTGNRYWLTAAIRAFREAGRLSSRFLEPHVNLYLARRPPSSTSSRARADAEVQLREIRRLDPRWQRGLLIEATASAEASGNARRQGHLVEAVAQYDRGKRRVAEVLGTIWAGGVNLGGDGDLGDRLAGEADAVRLAVERDDEDWRSALTVTQLNAMFTWSDLVASHAESSPHAALAAAALTQKLGRLLPENPHIIFSGLRSVPKLIGSSFAEPQLERLRQDVIARMHDECDGTAAIASVQAVGEAQQLRNLVQRIVRGTATGAAPPEVSDARAAASALYAVRLRLALEGLLTDPSSTMRFTRWLVRLYDHAGDSAKTLRLVARSAEDTPSPATVVWFADIILQRERSWDPATSLNGVHLAVRLLARAARMDAGAREPERSARFYRDRLDAALARLDALAGVDGNRHVDHWRTATVRLLACEQLSGPTRRAVDAWLEHATSTAAPEDVVTVADVQAARKLLLV